MQHNVDDSTEIAYGVPVNEVNTNKHNEGEIGDGLQMEQEVGGSHVDVFEGVAEGNTSKGSTRAQSEAIVMDYVVNGTIGAFEKDTSCAL